MSENQTSGAAAGGDSNAAGGQKEQHINIKVKA